VQRVSGGLCVESVEEYRGLLQARCTISAVRSTVHNISSKKHGAQSAVRSTVHNISSKKHGAQYQQ